MSWQTQVLALLEASLVRPLGLLVVAWLILRVLRVRHPASRHAVWTAVLVGMLLLPIVSVVTPHWTLPVLPWQHSEATPPLVATSTAVVPADVVPGEQAPNVVQQEPTVESSAGFAWPSSEALIVWCYLVGLLVMLAYRLTGWVLLRRVVSRSTPLRPACLRESADVVTPVAVGVLRPSVILPAGWRDWTAHTRRAVLAHEFAHLRRRDTLVAALARLIKCVFWFHPAAWWVSRQTSRLADLACDAVALQRVGDPAGYSRVLVEFAGVVRRSGQRVSLPGLAIASGSPMGKRIDDVFELSVGTMRKLARPMVWLLALGLPALCLAATVVPSTSAAAQNAAATADQSKFDIVSIKPCPGLPPPGTGRGQNPRFPATSPGYAHWGCVTLSELVNQAYAGEDYPLLNIANRRNPDYETVIRGGPSWVYSERFSVEVRAAGNSERAALTGAMLRAMLEDRFQLKLRHATEQQPMYGMTIAKSGLKLTPTAPTDCWVRPPGASPATPPPPGFEGKHSCGTMHGEFPNGNARVDITGMTLQGFAGYLSGILDHYVLDKTGVNGRFNIPLEYAPDEYTRDIDLTRPTKAGATVNASPDPPRGTGQNIFKALESLGLKLDTTKGPAEYLVIESVQRPRPDSPAVAAGAAMAGRPATAAEANVAGRPATAADTDSGNTPDGLSTNQNAEPTTQSTAAQAGIARFDVVSIKPCSGTTPPPASVLVEPGLRRGGAAAWHAQASPGYVRWDCVTLATLIDQAYADRDHPLLNMTGDSRPPRPDPARPGFFRPKRVRGGPSWVETETFTIEARAPLDVTNPALQGSANRNLAALPAPMSQALRAVLEDRFQLKVRRATEQQDMYALTVAKGGLNKDRMKPTTPGDCVTIDQYVAADPGSRGNLRICGRYFVTMTSWEFSGGTLKELAAALSSTMDLVVVDQTGVDRAFTYVLDLADRTARWDDLFIRAIETLGLRIERTKGPAEYFQIESVQKPRPDGPSDLLGPLARAAGPGTRSR